MDIASIVKELVFTGGSLIVPGLGKFSISRIPAEMDISARIITPPSRIIQFDELKTRDDGKLAALLAERYRLSHPEAANAVTRWVRTIKEELASRGRAAITSFGTLESGQKGISFKDDPFIMYSSLMPAIGFNTANREEAGIVERIPVKPSHPEEPGKRKLLIPALVSIFFVLALAAFFISGLHREFFNLSGKETGDAGSGDRNKIVFGRPPVYDDSLSEAISDNLDESTLKENALSYEEAGQQEIPSAALSQESITLPDDTPRMVTGQVETINTTVSGYHIIAGAYMVPDNAEKQKQMLENRGFKTIILPPQGSYYMVSLGSYSTLEQVTEVMNSLRSELDIPLWVKKI